MKKHWRYANYLFRHKWFVFVAGLKTKAPLWRLIIHDWSKLLPCEWFPYAQYFYGTVRNMDEKEFWRDQFNRAWLHHQHANPHHWQHWVLREDSGEVKLLRMPDNFVREMVADWMGAGRAITGKWETANWYIRNRSKIQLHNETREQVERLLGLPQQVAA